MKIRDYIRFIFRDFGKRKLVLALNVFCMTIAVFFMLAVIHTFHMIDYQAKVLDGLVGGNSENCYHIEVQTLTPDVSDYGKRVNTLIRELGNIDGVKGSGIYISSSVRFQELFGDERADKKAAKNGWMSEMSQTTDIIYVDKDILDMCRLSLQEGSDKEYMRQNDFYVPVIIGADYAEILSVGDILTDYVSGAKYKVIGIMEKNARFFYKDGLFQSETDTVLDSYMMMPSSAFGSDDSGLFVMNYINNIFLETEKGKGTQVKEEVLALAEKCDLKISCDSFTEMYEKNRDSNREDIEEIEFLIIAIIILATLGLISAGVIHTLMNTKRYGIMLACGFSQSSIRNLTAFENALKLIAATVLGYAFQWYITTTYYLSEQELEVELHVIQTEDLRTLLFILLFIMVLIIVFPVHVLKKKNISEIV